MNGSKYSSRVSILALSLALLGPVCKAQAVMPLPSSTDLTQRIEGLEKQLVLLRSELTAIQRESGRSEVATTPQESGVIQASVPIATLPPPPSLSGLLAGTTISGFVDTYYDYNSNQPATRANGFRSFDVNSNQFGLNLIKLQVDKAPAPAISRTGYRIAIGFGQAINAVNGSDPGGPTFDQYLEEGYFSYLAPVGKGLQVDVGKFVTPHGAEVIETKDNWNYSRGLLFSYAIPYFHYGLRAKYAFNDKYSVGGFLVNGWNNMVDNNTGKTAGLSFGWNPTKKVSVAQNYMAGPEAKDTDSGCRQLSDTVVSYAPTEKISFVVNYDYGRGDRDQFSDVADIVSWTGVAGFVRYAFNRKYAVATRYEYYDDRNGFTTGTAQHINEITGTFQHVIAEHILGRFEFRRDDSSQPIFERGTSVLVNTQNTFTAGLVFAFDSREDR